MDQRFDQSLLVDRALVGNRSERLNCQLAGGRRPHHRRWANPPVRATIHCALLSFVKRFSFPKIRRPSPRRVRLSRASASSNRFLEIRRNSATEQATMAGSPSRRLQFLRQLRRRFPTTHHAYHQPCRHRHSARLPTRHPKPGTSVACPSTWKEPTRSCSLLSASCFALWRQERMLLSHGTGNDEDSRNSSCRIKAPSCSALTTGG